MVDPLTPGQRNYGLIRLDFLRNYGGRTTFKEDDLRLAEEYLVKLMTGVNAKPLSSTFDGYRHEKYSSSNTGMENISLEYGWEVQFGMIVSMMSLLRLPPHLLEICVRGSKCKQSNACIITSFADTEQMT